ncbi:MAG: hypothetical protein M3R17_21445 [Bacteroidota bacterium]|nr:hypothetical protein [Bacteroidota bacterium]
MKQTALIFFLFSLTLSYCGPNTNLAEFEIEIHESVMGLSRSYFITENSIKVEFETENNTPGTYSKVLSVEEAIRIENALKKIDFDQLKNQYGKESGEMQGRFDFKITNNNEEKLFRVYDVRIKEIINLVEEINMPLNKDYRITYNKDYFSGQMGNISCTLTADKHVYSLEEAPELSVTIKNNSDSVVQFVKALDGSGSRLRFPHAYFKIEMPSDPSYQITTFIQRPDYDAISSDDFVEVRQGETFDPYKSQSGVYSDRPVYDSGNFTKPGTYLITFYYITDEPDFKKWLGNSSQVKSRWFDNSSGNIKAEKQKEYDELLDLFSKVPKVILMSDEVKIEIQ